MTTRIAKTISLPLLLVIILLTACQPAPAPSAPAPSAPQPTAVLPTPTSAPIPEETMPAPEEPISGEEEGTRGTLPQSTPETGEFDRPMAFVDSATLQVDGETGVASVLVIGNLADGCTELADVRQVFVDERLTINVYTSRDPDLMCTQALVPFETIIEIDAPVSAQDLTSGRVPIFVNGVPMGQVE